MPVIGSATIHSLDLHEAQAPKSIGCVAAVGALSLVDGRYVIDYAKMPKTLEQLAHQLLVFEDQGDRSGTEAWLTKYDKIPAALQKALALTANIPVDIDPVFSFPDEVK